jgi:hypothetical protein
VTGEYRPPRDPFDRNGEPSEDRIGCLVMLVCIAGSVLIVVAVTIAALVR